MDQYSDASRNQNEKTMAIQSVAMAGQNLLLAAHAQGLGACWMCAPLFCQVVVQKTLQCPADWQPQGLITLGYPSQTRSRDRKALESVRIVIE
jgi:nitroreductase